MIQVIWLGIRYPGRQNERFAPPSLPLTPLWTKPGRVFPFFPLKNPAHANLDALFSPPGPPTRTSKPSPEGRATIAKAEAGTKGAVVYGWLYIVSAARLWECTAAETYDYELQTLPSMTLLGRDPAFWRGNSVKEKAKTEAPAKEPIFASLPYPLRGVRVIPNSRARALVASARRYAMPRRFPGTWHAKGMSPGFLDAAPARTPSEEDSRDERTSNDDLMTVFRDAIKRSVTLRDEERAAARPFLEVAMRESRHKDWEVRSPEEAAAIAALRSPFPDIEEARRVRGEWDRFEGSPSEIVKALEAMDAAIQPRNRPLADCINDSPNTSRNASASTAVLHPDSSLDLDYLLMLDEGIRWALTTEGLLPQWYVDEVVRPWLPYKQSLDGQKSERERQKNGKLAEPMTTRRGRHAATHPTLIREDAMAWPETTQVFSGRLRSSRVG